MPVSWKLYKAVCIIQMMIAIFILFTSLINLFQNTLFGDAARILVFLLIIALSIMSVNILNNNYPNIPIESKQKKMFNWLFLLNFLFLAFLFGFIISEYRSVRQLSVLLNKNILQLPFGLLITPAFYILVLIFQMIMLYGLYVLRLLLYENFIKQEFEFEKN